MAGRLMKKQEDNKMFTTYRTFYVKEYGGECGCTEIEWDSLEKAIAYARRYAKGLRFAGVQIVDNSTDKMVFEITSDFEEYSYMEDSNTMFDKKEMQLVNAACDELKQIKTAKDFYSIVDAVNKKYGCDIANKAREIVGCYNSTQYPMEEVKTEAVEVKKAEELAKVKYYPINEDMARRASELNSFYTYQAGSATDKYRQMVDIAVEVAEKQKKRVDQIYHAKIDSLLDTYSLRLAENLNKGYEIDCRVPSILICGAGNFPTKKKEKQNATRDKNLAEYVEIDALLDKIRSTGTGGISSDDPQAIEKLQIKLAKLEDLQAQMKAVNAYYRKEKRLVGCPELSDQQVNVMTEAMAVGHMTVPFEPYQLANNSQKIRNVKDRINELVKRKKEPKQDGWAFDGGEVVFNTEINRLQIVFEDKPSEEKRKSLKHNGFRWSPSQGAWQRQITNNAVYAAKMVTKGA